jgi:hypothetical protein
VVAKDLKMNMIIYHAWVHRGSGEISVWLSNDFSSIRPVPQLTIASESKIYALHKVKILSAINDALVPKDANDRTIPYYRLVAKGMNNRMDLIRF